MGAKFLTVPVKFKEKAMKRLILLIILTITACSPVGLNPLHET
jgi:hypothetical protein